MIKLPLTVLLALLSSVGFVAVSWAVTGAPVGVAPVPAMTTPQPNVQIAQVADVEVAVLMTEGGANYQRQCAVCHGAGGEGGFGDRLIDSPIVASASGIVNQILSGALEHGMPAFAATLNDRQIAGIATFVRNSWGNAFGEIQPSLVLSARAAAPPAG